MAHGKKRWVQVQQPRSIFRTQKDELIVRKRVVCMGETRVHGGGRVVGSRRAGRARAGMGQGSCRAQPRMPAWGGLEAARAQRA